MKRATTWDAVACVVLVALVALLLAPVLAQSGRSYGEAKCQSNMRRLAEAVSLYLADNYNAYPSNRLLGGPTVSTTVQLTPLSYGADGYPLRFQNGVNWVEGLQNYVIDAARKTDQDWLSASRCPNASTLTYPQNSPTARVTYVINMCLLEQPLCVVRDPAKLMMIREVDRLVNAICRPTNGPACIGSPTTVPIGMFLNTWDPNIAPQPIDPNLHGGNGSHILFSDGHVRHFTAEYFPTRAWFTAANCWDDATQQWWNFGPGATSKPAYLIKSIAITP